MYTARSAETFLPVSQSLYAEQCTAVKLIWEADMKAALTCFNASKLLYLVKANT